MKKPIERLLEVMARLRSPKGGCPWDLEQSHASIRYYAVEEAYELIDAIEARDDHEMIEELGDMLLQVVFHSQMACERGAFDFERVCQAIVDKLIHRHPHVFGESKADDAQAVLRQWEQIKRAEKAGTHRERPSALDGIPRHLPSLMRAEKLARKAAKAGLADSAPANKSIPPARTPAQLGALLYELADLARRRGWNSEALLSAEIKRRERGFRRSERAAAKISRQPSKPLDRKSKAASLKNQK